MRPFFMPMKTKVLDKDVVNADRCLAKMSFDKAIISKAQSHILMMLFGYVDFCRDDIMISFLRKSYEELSNAYARIEQMEAMLND